MDDPLSVVCPECDAPAGERCRNYLGNFCAPHGKRNESIRSVRVDLDRLWTLAVNHALDHIQNNDVEKKIKYLLDLAGGDVIEAMKLLTKLWSPDNTISEYIGNFGACMRDYRIDAMGPAASGRIEVWAGGDHWDRPPDLIIRWREVFEYVKAGRKRTKQLSLF